MPQALKPRFQFALVVLLAVAVNVGSGLLSDGAKTATGLLLLPWLVTMALMILSFAIIGRLPPIVDWRALLIDQRNKISLSRLQLVVWTILVISTILTEGVLNSVWGQPKPLELAIPSQLWILLGISTTSAVAAPVVLGMKGAALDTNAINGHGWRDIFYGDDTGNADQVDVSKVQQFFFTVVLVGVYAINIGSVLASAIASSSMLTFPPLDSGFIAIMGVSQTAYIAYKAVPQNKTDAPNPGA
jgi:hypothetical protein